MLYPPELQALVPETRQDHRSVPATEDRAFPETPTFVRYGKATTVSCMSKCRATSFYLAPGKLLYFEDHVVAARIDPASAAGFDEWFLVPITHRRDVARIRALYPGWNGVIAHVPVKTLKGRAFSVDIDRKAAGWEHKALAAAALEAPQLVNLDVTSERTIEGRRPYKAGDDAGRVTYLVTRWNRELLDTRGTTNGKTPLAPLGGPGNLVAELFPPDAQGRKLSKGRTRKLVKLVTEGYVAQVASAAILVSNGLIDPHSEEGGKIFDAFLAAQSLPLPVSVPQVLTTDLEDLLKRSRAAGIEVDLVKVLADAVRPERVLWPEGALLIAGSRAASPAMRTAIRALVTQDPVPEAYAPWASSIREALDAIDAHSGTEEEQSNADYVDAPINAPIEAPIDASIDTQSRRERVRETFDTMAEELADTEHQATLAELTADDRSEIRQEVAKEMLRDGRDEYLEFLAEFEGVAALDEIGRVARVLRGEQFPHPAEQALVEHMLTVDVLNETQKPSRSTKTFAELDSEETALIARIQRATAPTRGDASTDSARLVRASLADPSTGTGREALQDLARHDPDARNMLISGGVLAVRNHARVHMVEQSGNARAVDAWFTELDRVREEKPRLCTTRDDLAKFGETRVLSATELSPAQNTQARKLHKVTAETAPTDVHGEPVDVKVITTRAALKMNADEMHNCTWDFYEPKVFSRRTSLILRVECAASHAAGRRLFNVGLSKVGGSRPTWEIGEVNTVGNSRPGWPECTPGERDFVRKVVQKLLNHEQATDDSAVVAQGDIPIVTLPVRSERRQAATEGAAPETPVPANAHAPADAPSGIGARIRRLLLPRRNA